MKNLDAVQLQFAIASIISGLVHLIVLIATIIMFVKKRTTATIFLLIGSVLTSVGYAGGFIYNAMAAQKGSEALINAQVNLNFFNAFSFLVFGVGLFLLALNFNKKN